MLVIDFCLFLQFFKETEDLYSNKFYQNTLLSHTEINAALKIILNSFPKFVVSRLFYL
jgi:hypothetical protein